MDISNAEAIAFASRLPPNCETVSQSHKRFIISIFKGKSADITFGRKTYRKLFPNVKLDIKMKISPNNQPTEDIASIRLVSLRASKEKRQRAAAFSSMSNLPDSRIRLRIFRRATSTSHWMLDVPGYNFLVRNKCQPIPPLAGGYAPFGVQRFPNHRTESCLIFMNMQPEDTRNHRLTARVSYPNFSGSLDGGINGIIQRLIQLTERFVL